MNIVVLDGFTLNPGDLSWDELKQLGSCEIYARTAPAEVIPRGAQADVLLTNKTVLAPEHLGALPRLKYVGVLATGTNVVDLAAARARQVPVTNVPAYGTKSVAQATMALLLELTQHVGHHAQTVREGQWSHNRDWCYWQRPLIELDGRTLGIIGFGRIGRTVAEMAVPFGLQILAYNRSSKAAPAFVRFVDLETLFRESDVVSLHCPLSPETQGLINAQRLAWMKPTALLLNTARGPLVDERALAEALNTGRIAGAGLDVLSVEPPPEANPLLTARHCYITPHLAWATQDARRRLLGTAVANLKAFLRGEPQNVVN
jgi:glycerate dehydrogenase